MRTLAALTLALSIVPITALAQDRGSSTEVRVETFTDADTVTGTIEGPLGDSIQVRPRAQRRTLIQPRANFHPELYESVQDL